MAEPKPTQRERAYGLIACAVIGVLIGLVTFALGLNVLDVFHG